MSDTVTSVLEAAKPKRSLWPLLVVALIALNMTIVAITVVKANSDPTNATEPNYYDKALKFNTLAAERDASKALGWKCDASFEPGASGTLLTLSLLNHEGKPVEGGVVTAEVFSNLRASERTQVPCEEVLPGVYASRVLVDRAGLWTVRVRAERGAEVFVYETEVLVPQPASK